MVADFWRDGWAVFGPEPAVENWAKAVLPHARQVASDPVQQATWLQCGGTWFVGVDALANDAKGAVGQGPALTGAAMDFVTTHYGDLPLHPGQLSVIYPGYPRPRSGESDSAFAYRKNRDAAHVDGLLAIGATRQRMLREPHAWVMGLPLNECSHDASPLVVWQGSHHIMRAAFAAALKGHAPVDWTNVDLTAPYQAARRQVFATCPRVTVPARPGQGYIVHRHALHGVAPWSDSATAPQDGRMIAYFRPQLQGSTGNWLAFP
jgi:hypothetical protein